MMSDLNDNQFEDFEEESPTPPEDSGKPSGNRNFIIAIGVLGGISLLILIVLIIVGLVILPAQSKARKEQAALVNAQNTATSQAATQIAFAKAQATKTPTATNLPSATPVVAIATATPETIITVGTPVVAQDLSARTQTVAALLTQAAGGNGTATPTAKATALPTTGFADEVGLPVLFGLALLLVVVIFVVRRLRLSSSS
jgi:LPXTG-motif cell wall-anchored protein